MAKGNRAERGKQGSNETLDPVRAATEYGIDVLQLRGNLALTVAERLRRHQIAPDTVEMLRKAKQP